MTNIITYTMLSTTNERFKYLEGSSNTLVYDEELNIYWFGNFHTSNVRQVNKTRYEVEITTLNSVYKFKRNKKETK